MITIVLALIYSFCFEHTVSLSIPIKRHNFWQIPLYNSGVTRFESWTISHTFAVILAATAPPPRWRRKPWKGLYRKSALRRSSVDLISGRSPLLEFAKVISKRMPSPNEVMGLFSRQKKYEVSVFLEHHLKFKRISWLK